MGLFGWSLERSHPYGRYITGTNSQNTAALTLDLGTNLVYDSTDKMIVSSNLNPNRHTASYSDEGFFAAVDTYSTPMKIFSCKISSTKNCVEVASHNSSEGTIVNLNSNGKKIYWTVYNNVTGRGKAYYCIQGDKGGNDCIKSAKNRKSAEFNEFPTGKSYSSPYILTFGTYKGLLSYSTIDNKVYGLVDRTTLKRVNPSALWRSSSFLLLSVDRSGIYEYFVPSMGGKVLPLPKFRGPPNRISSSATQLASPFKLILEDSPRNIYLSEVLGTWTWTKVNNKIPSSPTPLSLGTMNSAGQLFLIDYQSTNGPIWTTLCK